MARAPGLFDVEERLQLLSDIGDQLEAYGHTFTVVNAHLYFDSSSQASEDRRALETYALGRWAQLRASRGDAYSGNTVVIGDLNMPLAQEGDQIYDALVARGLHVPKHHTKIGTTISEGKHYDQLAFFPQEAGGMFLKSGVFDFDGAVFADLWAISTPELFDEYVRYHLSDHRPIWAQFDLSGPLRPNHTLHQRA